MLLTEAHLMLFDFNCLGRVQSCWIQTHNRAVPDVRDTTMSDMMPKPAKPQKLI